MSKIITKIVIGNSSIQLYFYIIHLTSLVLLKYPCFISLFAYLHTLIYTFK